MAVTDSLPLIPLADPHTYVAFFLTFGCNLDCGYCLNRHNEGSRYRRSNNSHLDVERWIKAADRLVLRDDLPLTFQGGEPTIHKGFYRFVNEVKPSIKMDLLTNMMFNVETFARRIPPWRFERDAPYASIRVTYHPGQNDIDDLIRKTMYLQEAGFRIGLYGILHPDADLRKHIIKTMETCLNLGLDFRTKEFLGEWNNQVYGTFKYPGSVNGAKLKTCRCRTSELIVGPGGYVYRCHADLYLGRAPVAHILDTSLSEEAIDLFRPCAYYGSCHPCDVKVKTNRFQIFGHTSVEITDVE